MIIYRSFADNSPRAAYSYQSEAYVNAVNDGQMEYNKNRYVFTLQKCRKFNDTYFLIRNDETLSGILTTNPNIEVRSTHELIRTAMIGVTNGQSREVTSDKDYCVEYAGNIVEIRKGERIWLNPENKIIIGWHGSYSPPHGCSN